MDEWSHWMDQLLTRDAVVEFYQWMAEEEDSFERVRFLASDGSIWNRERFRAAIGNWQNGHPDWKTTVRVGFRNAADAVWFKVRFGAI